MSRKSPDRRPSCGKSSIAETGSLFIGGCAQHKNHSEDIPRLRNTTKFKDYVSGSTTYIDPYPLAESITAPDCSPYNTSDPFYFECGDGINGNLYCGPSNPSLFQTCSNNNKFTVGNVYTNSFENTSETASYSNCRKIGVKSVYAKKAWNGIHGFNSKNYAMATYMDWCTACSYAKAQQTPDTTKYLAISGSAHTHRITNEYTSETVYDGQVCCDGCTSGCDPNTDPNCGCFDNICRTNYVLSQTVEVVANATNGTHVDKFGNFYVDSCSSGSSGYTGEYADLANSQNAADCFALLVEKGNSTVNTIGSVYLQYLGMYGGQTPTVTGDGNHWKVEFHTDFKCYNECGCEISSTDVVICSLEIDLAAGTLDVYTYGTKPANECCTSGGSCGSIYSSFCGGTWVQTCHIQYAYSETTMNYTCDITGIGSLSFDDNYHETVSATLSQPYTADEAHSEMIELMENYPLHDDVLLPWRCSQDLMGPLVSYDEGTAMPTLGVCETGSLLYTGRIMGMPGPKGIDRIWNPLHRNYDACDSLVQPGCYVKFQKTWGGWSDSVGIPHATQWLNKWEASQMPQGAFCGMGFMWTTPSNCNSTGPTPLNDGVIWGCKYAEVLVEPRKSYNYARPCGADRWQISQSGWRCIQSITDNVVTVDYSQIAPYTVNEKVYVCGTAIDGVYTIANNDGYNVTLGDCVVSGSDILQKPSEDCGTGMICSLRWQGGVPAICGRVDVSSITKTTPITCSLSEPTHLIKGDLVIVSDAKGAPINKVWKIQSVIDSQTVVLSGSTGVGSNYTGSTAYMYSPFAADWKWNDDLPKHDYTVLTWNFNYRDVGEYNRIVGVNSSMEWNYDCNSNLCGTASNSEQPRLAQANCGMSQFVSTMSVETSCQTANACKPNVAFFSPNSSDFSGSKTAINHGFGKPTFDDVYGSMWNGLIKQTDTDYLWQTPPCPCSFNPDVWQYGCNCGMAEDDGTGQEDGGTPCIKRFRHSPQIESRAEIPNGAPFLPNGCYIGCLTPPDFQNGKCGSGNVCNPPFANANASYTDYTPLIQYPYYCDLFLKELGCVCSEGRFSEDYQQDGVLCPNNQIVSAP